MAEVASTQQASSAFPVALQIGGSRLATHSSLNPTGSTFPACVTQSSHFSSRTANCQAPGSRPEKHSTQLASACSEKDDKAAYSLLAKIQSLL